MIPIRMTKQRWSFALLTLVLVSAVSAYVIDKAKSESTDLASTEISKAERLKKFNDEAPFQGKGRGIVQIEITSPEKGDSPVGSIIELVASVTAKRPSESYEFTWLLPEGVSVAGGETQGVIGRMERGDQTQLRLSVVKNTEENRQIHLHVFTRVGNKSRGKMAQFNTVDQTRIDAEIRTKAEIIRSRMPAADGTAHRKLMQ